MFHSNISHASADQRLSDETSNWINMRGVRVHYKSIGQGPTIVLVHNSGMWGGVWETWIPFLSSKFHLVIPDLPGCGLTGKISTEDYSYAALTKFLCSFIEQTCDGPVHVVGLSLGGQLAWRCALLQPDLLKSLVLINPTGYPEKALPAVFKFARGPMGWLLRFMGSKEMMRKNIGQIWGKGDPVSDAFLDRLVVSQCRKGNRPAFLKFLRTENESLHAQLPKIHHPVQLQWSARCGPQHFSEDLSNVELVVHEKFGNLPNLEAPELTATAAAHFIDACEKGIINVQDR